MALLEIDRVTKTFTGREGRRVVAASDVSLCIEAGETLGLVGESGSGKSTLARIVLGLLAPDEGSVRFDGVEPGRLRGVAARRARRPMTAVFQEPFQQLNPRRRIASIVAEPLRIQSDSLGRFSRAELRRRVAAQLEEVSLPESLLDRYPAELSGGQQQRVSIARAMIVRPKLVVLDEPTSSLDLSVRATVIELLLQLRRSHDLAYLLISHDLDTVAYLADRIAVMHDGMIVEQGAADDILDHPVDPYTIELLQSRLSTDPTQRHVHA